ncbi:efflux RND transporter periplasmic adaptor subunit [Aureliella helgolandensis]|uniref:Putative efflux pump membrane fusion protein n=1 Tax=Aureliella helgolandensis TaxID=2527968 RepID=A0A518G1J9_9BACT|nr:efflux RND transporter periplasmic adaptor subunit [Aureliella helgolandensis]QDV22414.1 putative efflux pump membrane fusion protein [Aureliella helgolandensis]
MLLRPYWLVFSVLLAWGGLVCSPNELKAQADFPLVEVAAVIETPVDTAYRVIGTVNPLRTSMVGSAVAGRVLEVYVNQGDAVEAGQPLAQLRTDTLELELAAAEAELELYRQQLAEMVNGSRVEDIAEAKARSLGAKAAMENAARQLQRLEELMSSGAAIDADIEDARERSIFTQYTHAAAEATLARVEKGPRSEQIAQAAARVELQQQNVLVIKDRIVKHTMIAPFDGFISAKFTEIGAWIESGGQVAEVIELKEVEIQAPTTAENATKLKRGDTVRVEFPELPHKLLTGVVHRIVPVADSRARTFPVLIRLQNEIIDDSPLLLSGMMARIDLPTGKPQVLPLVPKDALVLNQLDRSVFVVEMERSGETGTVRKVPVELGIAMEGLIQVTGDLSAGDLVVVLGNERLIPNSQVRVTNKVISQTAKN